MQVSVVFKVRCGGLKISVDYFDMLCQKLNASFTVYPSPSNRKHRNVGKMSYLIPMD